MGGSGFTQPVAVGLTRHNAGMRSTLEASLDLWWVEG
jgi:hypothetical protein